jgi:hypothetical protein
VSCGAFVADLLIIISSFLLLCVHSYLFLHKKVRRKSFLAAPSLVVCFLLLLLLSFCMATRWSSTPSSASGSHHTFHPSCGLISENYYCYSGCSRCSISIRDGFCCVCCVVVTNNDPCLPACLSLVYIMSSSSATRIQFALPGSREQVVLSSSSLSSLSSSEEEQELEEYDSSPTRNNNKASVSQPQSQQPPAPPQDFAINVECK